MKIGILGTGHIGGLLAQRLSAAGHDVKVANSREPQTVDAAVLSSGARAVTSAQATTDVDVLILSIPFGRILDVAPLVAAMPTQTIIIDTANYYPQRDGHIDAIDEGQVESLWVSELLSRSIAKAWNAIGSHSLASKAKPAGSPGRVAIPVAADSDRHRKVAMGLVEDTGLDAVDAGVLANSWRQQPGAPCYCVDLGRDEVPAALAAADRARLTARRDLAFSVIMERMGGDGSTNPDADFGVRLARLLYS